MKTSSITGTAPFSHGMTDTLLLSEAPAHKTCLKYTKSVTWLSGTYLN
jgi:hypothetical protein